MELIKKWKIELKKYCRIEIKNENLVRNEVENEIIKPNNRSQAFVPENLGFKLSSNTNHQSNLNQSNF